MSQSVMDDCACGCGEKRRRRYNPHTGEKLRFIKGHFRSGAEQDAIILTTAERSVIREEIAAACGWTESRYDQLDSSPVTAENYRVKAFGP